MKSQKYLVPQVLCVILLLGGCSTAVMVGAGAGAGIGSYSYVKGELIMDYPYDLDQTWNASLTALDRLEIQITESKKDSLGGRIAGKWEDKKPVVVKVKNKGLGVTKVGVRVGQFGDRDASQRIHETILNFVES